MFETVGHHNLFYFVIKYFLDEFAQTLGGGFHLLETLLLVLTLGDLQTFLGGTDQFLALEFLELLYGVFIDGIRHEQHLNTLLLQSLQKGRVFDLFLGFTGYVVDVGLIGRHTTDVIVKTGQYFTRFGRIVAKELGEFGTVGRILVDAQFDVLAELLVELDEFLGVVGDVADHVDGLLDEILLDHTQDLVLLQAFTRDVER